MIKKFFSLLSIAILTAVCLASCKYEKKCWSIRSTLGGVPEVKYFWGTEDEAVTEIKRMESMESRKDVAKTEEKSFKTSSDCLANNSDI